MHIDFKKKTNDRHFQKAKILEEILLSKKKKKKNSRALGQFIKS